MIIIICKTNHFQSDHLPTVSGNCIDIIWIASLRWILSNAFTTLLNVFSGKLTATHWITSLVGFFPLLLSFSSSIHKCQELLRSWHLCFKSKSWLKSLGKLCLIMSLVVDRETMEILLDPSSENWHLHLCIAIHISERNPKKSPCFLTELGPRLH